MSATGWGVRSALGLGGKGSWAKPPQGKARRGCGWRGGSLLQRGAPAEGPAACRLPHSPAVISGSALARARPTSSRARRKAPCFILAPAEAAGGWKGGSWKARAGRR